MTADLPASFDSVRSRTEELTRTLAVEDFVVSSMTDVSPTKWHLAHTSWFFETFVLGPHAPGYEPVDRRYAYLFNSYYVQAGERHCRAQRGLVTRPTVAEVFDYRAHVDKAVRRLLDDLSAQIADDPAHPVARLVELGCHHEQQHQELLLTDIKHVLWTNPLQPAFIEVTPVPAAPVEPVSWVAFDEGLYEIGRDGVGDGASVPVDGGFAFDNEGPRHRVWLDGFSVADRLVTNGEYLQFIEDGGYRRAPLWLSEGFGTVTREGWRAPLYWDRGDDGWAEFTLAGAVPLDPAAPVTHVSYFEADAFARWAGHRLPSEAQWEVAAAGQPVTGRFVEAGRYHPAPAVAGDGLHQLYGDVWQWTQTPYLAYPGFVPDAGAIGEYNGKFMCDQWVLRGASCATPTTHARATYRNFWPAATRFQFSGIRLAS